MLIKGVIDYLGGEKEELGEEDYSYLKGRGRNEIN